MDHYNLKILLIIFFCFVLIVESASAQEIYNDDFDTLNFSEWTAITSDTWGIVNGMVSSSGGRPGLIFNKLSGETYISEIDMTGNDNLIADWIQLGFYFYYEEPNNYGRIVLADDNRGEDYYDQLKIETEGISLINTQININTSTNTSVEWDVMQHLKVVRLNKNVYVYSNDNLILTTEFKDDVKKGSVGFDITSSTGYFDNFYLRPITMKNASDYINELNLDSTNPTTRIGSIYTLSLDEVSNGDALFTLNKFGKTVDIATASQGQTVSLDFENGEEGVNFKVTRLFEAENNSAVWLEDIISASTDDLNLAVDKITLNPSYHQEEDMDIRFSITNQGGIRFTGTPGITITTQGSSQTLNPELDLASNESGSFNATLTAPQKPGSQTITISVKTEYSTIEGTADYQVKALNPAVTTLSADLREDNGIRGTVSLESPFPPDLVDWNTTALVKVYAVAENGKREVYSQEVPVTSDTFNIAVSYDEFYQGDGQYLVAVEIGGIQDNEFFEIVGPDYAYAPADRKLPPTIVSNDLYPQIIMLLLGMFAALSVRNHMHPASRSLPLDLVLIVCGSAVLAVALVGAQSDMAAVGIVLMGIGVGAAVIKKSDSPIGAMLQKDSHLHDYAGMLLVFLSAGYIVMLVPQWSFMVIIGTLIGYYTALNLYRGSGGE